MRKFDHNSTWEDVQNMTIEEAIAVLSHDADSDGKEWSARPHKGKAAQMAIEALKKTDQMERNGQPDRIKQRLLKWLLKH